MENVAAKSFTAEQLRNLITGPDELALIDLREGGVFFPEPFVIRRKLPAQPARNTHREDRPAEISTACRLHQCFGHQTQ